MVKFYRVCLLFLVLPLTAQAFDYTKMSELVGDPEKMQQEAEKMAKTFAEAANCMNDEDFKKMQAEGQAVGEKIKALCDKGDRGGAEKTAAEYSKKMLASEEFKKLQKCSEQLVAGLPQTFVEAGQAQVAKTGAGSEEPPHICDMEQF